MSAERETDASQKWMIRGGAVVLLLIVGAALWPAARRQIFNDNSVGCELSAAGVGLIVAGVTRGRNSASVWTALAPIGASAACRGAINTWIEDPDTDVDIAIVGREDTSTISVSGNQLRDLVPNAAQTTTCDDWLLGSLREMCREGTLDPPVTSLRISPVEDDCSGWLLPSWRSLCEDGVIDPWNGAMLGSE